MKKMQPMGSASSRDSVAEELRAAERFGRFRLGTENLFIRKGLRFHHLPYSAISACWLQVDSAGLSDLPVDIHHIVVSAHGGEVTRGEISDYRMACAFLQKMAQRAPDSGVRVPKKN